MVASAAEASDFAGAGRLTRQPYRITGDPGINHHMLLGTGVPLQDPVQLQARLAAVAALLEDQTSAVERLRAERDSLRAGRPSATRPLPRSTSCG